MDARRLSLVCATLAVMTTACAQHEFLLFDGGGTGAGLVSTTSLAFTGFVGCGTEQRLTLRNIGDGPLQGMLPLTAGGGTFTLLGGGSFVLEPGQVREVRVRFEPTDTNPVEADLRMPGGARTVHLSGQAAPPPTCVVSVTSLDFGTFTGGTACPERSFTVRNTGPGLLEGTAQSTCADFLILSDPHYSLSTGQLATLVIQYAPLTIGSAQCELDVGAPCFCQNVSCTGSATDIAAGRVTTATGSTLPFGSVLADGQGVGTSRTLDFTVTNGSSSPLNVNPAFSQAAPDFEILGSAQTLAPSASANYSVRFDPDDDCASYRDWSLTITGLGGCALPVTGRGEVRFASHVQSQLVCCAQCHTTNYAWASGNANTSDPPNSLLLRKAAGQVSHAGSGSCLWSTSGVEYCTTLAWIQQGILP